MRALRGTPIFARVAVLALLLAAALGTLPAGGGPPAYLEPGPGVGEANEAPSGSPSNAPAGDSRSAVEPAAEGLRPAAARITQPAACAQPAVTSTDKPGADPARNGEGDAFASDSAREAPVTYRIPEVSRCAEEGPAAAAPAPTPAAESEADGEPLAAQPQRRPGAPDPMPDPIVYADDPDWATTGTWRLERYTMLPAPFTGPADLLVANDAGASASYAIPGKVVKGSGFTLFGSRYRQGGLADVYLIQGREVKWSGVVDFHLDADEPAWDQPLFTFTFPNNGRNWRFEIVARGTGSCPDPDWHFVNIQYIQYNY